MTSLRPAPTQTSTDLHLLQTELIDLVLRPLPTDLAEQIDQAALLDSISKVATRRRDELREWILAASSQTLTSLTSQVLRLDAPASFSLLGVRAVATIQASRPADRVQAKLIRDSFGDDVMRQRGWLVRDPEPTISVRFSLT